MVFTLAEHQVKAIENLESGKVLVGGVGSGKSIASLAFANRRFLGQKVLVITTAKKRDSGEWFGDAMKMSFNAELEVDSWNNIRKYEDVTGCFVIFDEQRLVGSGAWVKSFYKIAANNPWILLSATPADSWSDLIPVFVANGFYANKTEFIDDHVKYLRFVKYPKIDRYVDTHRLEKYRKAIYVEMPYLSNNKRELHIIDVGFNLDEQRAIYADRWNIYDKQPVGDAGEMMRLLRRNANSHPDRVEQLKKIIAKHDRVIVFYNHNYELEILRTLMPELDIPYAEWNGHIHQNIPMADRWMYLVQYQAGGEGWNCTTTDTMVFYSLPYSYRNYEQAKGRIDRLNTKYEVLHYYIFKSRAIIDQGIWRSLNKKKDFQKSAFGKRMWEKNEKPKRALIDKHN